MCLGTYGSLRNVKFRDTMRLCHYWSSFENWESLKICCISKVCEVWQTDWRTTQHIIGLHRRQQFLSVQRFVSTWILKGIICCLVSGAGAGLIVSAVVTLTCWPHSVQNGPMLQFPAPPLRCHSNGCLCAEMSRNGTKPDNFQWHTDTERYIAAHCQAAASKLGLKSVRKLYL